MANVRVILELGEGGEQAPVMRWERSGTSADGGAFELLGRAFEVAQRECGRDFHEGIMAFFRGAMIQREDLAEILQRMGES